MNEKNINEKTPSRTITQKDEDLVPFIGDSIVEDQKDKIGTGAARHKEFKIYFQQRNRLKIKIEEGKPVEDKAMDGLRAFLFPDIKGLSYSKKDFLDIYVNTPIKDFSVFENYGLKEYNEENRINFGYMVFSAPNLTFDDQIEIEDSEGDTYKSDYVVPLNSKISYKEAKRKKMPGSMFLVDMDWEQIKREFENNDTIEYSLFTKDEEEFRWEHPISMKMEIEDYIVSELNAFEGEEPEGSKMLETSRLATVNFEISNTTFNQVFASNLENVEILISFEGVHKELIQPTALQIISAEEGNAEYLLEKQAINWILDSSMTPGQKRTLKFKLDREIIQRVENFYINIAGVYEENPQMFDSYTYVTPMGFPVQIKSNENEKERGTVWNPGKMVFNDPGKRYFKPDENACKVEYGETFKPSFSQEAKISKENLSKSALKNKFVEILNKSNQFLLEFESKIKNMKKGKKS